MRLLKNVASLGIVGWTLAAVVVFASHGPSHLVFNKKVSAGSQVAASNFAYGYYYPVNQYQDYYDVTDYSGNTDYSQYYDQSPTYYQTPDYYQQTPDYYYDQTPQNDVVYYNDPPVETYTTYNDNVYPYYPDNSNPYSDSYTEDPSYVNSEGVVEAPWYVQKLHGIGTMVQYIVPGLAPVPTHVVIPPPPPPPVYPQPSCTVYVNPSITQYGGNTTISWMTWNADKAVLQGIGAVALNGTYVARNLTASRAFALAVAGKGGTSSCYTVVSVGSLTITPPRH